jgi:hypothetical protein
MTGSSRLALAGAMLFVLGTLPLLALACFSPGLGSEGVLGWSIFVAGLLTLGVLGWAARRHPWMWPLVVLQLFLLGLVLYETFTGRLYSGT